MSAYEYIRFETPGTSDGSNSIAFSALIDASQVSSTRAILYGDNDDFLGFDTDAAGTTATLSAQGTFTGVGSATFRAIGIRGQATVIDANDFTGTAGSVVFSDGSSVVEDNSNLFWDDTNNRLGVGTATPDTNFHIEGPGNSVVDLRIEDAQTTAGGFPSLTLKDQGGAADHEIWSLRTGDASDFSIGELDDAETNFTRHFSIQDTTGNVGIGNFDATIDLAIGDADTGFEQSSEGVLNFLANNHTIATISGDVMNMRAGNGSTIEG